MRPFSNSSIVFNAATQETGFPPKVLACVPGSQSMSDLLATVAPSGSPEAIPLAMVTISGIIPQCSMANILPVLPIPAWTSSSISRISYFVASSFNLGKKSAGGITYPPSPWIGSKIIAATSSGGAMVLKI